MTSRPWLLLPLLLCLSCAADASTEPDVGMGQSLLSASQRRVRAGQIRDAAYGSGITQGWLLAGIADAETQMSHCWSELTWACKGPDSRDCGGGPVVAGAGDGPCSLRQGGLGMFQFDAGTFSDTLEREGRRVLRIDGNVEAAVDFVVAMVIRSAYIDGVSTREEALAWMNGVRVGTPRFRTWIKTVTHYYNGCAPTYSCYSQRYAHYRGNTRNVFEEMGAEFWVVAPDDDGVVDAPIGVDELQQIASGAFIEDPQPDAGLPGGDDLPIESSTDTRAPLPVAGGCSAAHGAEPHGSSLVLLCILSMWLRRRGHSNSDSRKLLPLSAASENVGMLSRAAPIVRPAPTTQA